MPISREEFEGKGVDWRQRILVILNAERPQAYSETELMAYLQPSPPLEELQEALRLLMGDGFVLGRVVRGEMHYIHALRGRD